MQVQTNMRKQLMKLSKDTINKLKNFSEINSNILLKSGNRLDTITEGSNLMASVAIPETLSVSESGFGIYDLNEFLGIVSLFEEPDLEFSDKFVVISQGKTAIKYFAAAPDLLTYPKREYKFPSAEIEFDLSASIVASIRKVAAVLKAADVRIIGDGTDITIQVGDKKNATASSYNTAVGSTDKEFVVNLKVDNLKLLPGDYQVAISTKKAAQFTSGDVNYIMAIEADSTFNL